MAMSGRWNAELIRRVITWAASGLIVILSTATAANAAVTGLRVGIYSGTGADASAILALFRAVAALGHSPMALTKADLDRGRLTPANFDVFIVPPGEDGKTCCFGYYRSVDALDQLGTKAAIRSYLTSGGGIVAEEAGASFSAQNGGSLDIYAGNYTNLTNQIGKRSFTITDGAFGAGTQEAWHSNGGGYFPTPPTGVSVAAIDTLGRPVIVHQNYGAGRLILTSFVLELRGDSTLDWTIWDNWAMGATHQNSVGAWAMLGRMIGWASYAQDPSAPVIAPPPNPPGAAIAVVAQHTTDGGAWPGLLPAVARGIEYSGNVPLAIRFQDIKDGRLTLANFRVVTFPGGYAYGYKTGLAGFESAIRGFIRSGGSYYGICAGAFYTPRSLVWENTPYPYPLGIYSGQIIGPINDIAPWPGYALTPVDFNDDRIGNFGRVSVMYYGGGYHTLPPPADPRFLTNQASPISVAGTFSSSSALGQADLVRYEYGEGRVALTTTHLETRAGSADDDWLSWDDFDYVTGNPVINPDNPWEVMKAIFTNWLAPPGM
jgi:glutamine amidotransferase-like uncharacterized protein